MSRTVHPADEANVSLVRLVHPADWTNPRPTAPYDLVVLGGGTAGLVCAVGAAGLGAKVALVERDLLGGDCLNSGCVPSKAIIRSARALGEIVRARSLGISTSEADVHFAGVMARMRRRRRHLAEHDSAQRLAGLGIDVYFGTARFVDDRTIDVSGARLQFGRAVIATGARAAVPPIPGLDTVPFLTNDTIFSLTELPSRLAVLGGGPIGCEMAQAFARFGSVVTVVDQSPRILSNDDQDAAAVVHRQMSGDGVRFRLGVRVSRVADAGGAIRLFLDGDRADGTGETLDADALLVATGRQPNVEDLDCAAAGIETATHGVVVDDHLRTTNRRVYASGDVCSKYKFTHAADAMSRIVIQNALFFGWRKASALVMPWATYTDPELAHVGVTAAEVETGGGRYASITVPFAEVDRAVVDDHTDGFVRVHHEDGRLRGCTIVAPHAGEMIGLASYALTHGATMAQWSATIYPYPTLAEALRKAGDAYRRTSLTPAAKTWLRRYFAWTR